MYARTIAWSDRAEVLWHAPGLLLRSLQLALNFPAPIFLLTLVIFLFRPPDLDFYHADRIAFCGLCFFVALRALAQHEKLPFVAGLSLPMIGLIVLATLRAYRGPFDAQNWSLVANKFVVPFVLFHLAVLVFKGSRERVHFELFVIAALAYLIFAAVAFLVGARSLIFPPFILDESIGLHADRARGPFLQAVANGVALNLLGLLALAVSGRTKRRLALLLWLALPWAVLATMTRSVWIGFAGSIVVLAISTQRKCLMRAWPLVIAGAVLIPCVIFAPQPLRSALSERAEETGPITARLAVYEAAWSMIQERPLAGWPPSTVYRELARRMPGYRLPEFYVHNTYLALLLEFGWPGPALYGIVFWRLFRLAKSAVTDSDSIFRLRKIWPLLLAVFLFNGLFVDMAYQFVIGLVFTVAGMLCASVEVEA